MSEKTHITFWIQEGRPYGWIDYAHKDSAAACYARIKELNKRKPGRVFRTIARVTKDYLIADLASLEKLKTEA